MTSQRPGLVLAIRADLDALSIKQQNDQVRPVMASNPLTVGHAGRVRHHEKGTYALSVTA